MTIFSNLAIVNAPSAIEIVIVLSVEEFAVKVGLVPTPIPPDPAKVKVLS